MDTQQSIDTSYRNLGVLIDKGITELNAISALIEGFNRQIQALSTKDNEDFCPICGDPNQNGLGFCCVGHRDLHYSEHEPNLHQEDKPSNPGEFYDIDEGMGIKE